MLVGSYLLHSVVNHPICWTCFHYFSCPHWNLLGHPLVYVSKIWVFGFPFITYFILVLSSNWIPQETVFVLYSWMLLITVIQGPTCFELFGKTLRCTHLSFVSLIYSENTFLHWQEFVQELCPLNQLSTIIYLILDISVDCVYLCSHRILKWYWYKLGKGRTRTCVLLLFHFYHRGRESLILYDFYIDRNLFKNYVP